MGQNTTINTNNREMCKTHTHSFLGQVGINMANMASLNNGGPTLRSTKNSQSMNSNSGQNCGNNQSNANYKNMMAKDNNQQNQHEGANGSVVNNIINGAHT